MGGNQKPEKPAVTPCLFSVSTKRSLPVSVLILDQDKQYLDLLQLLFTEGDLPWLPYIYVACSGFQLACYEITMGDYAARWRLGRQGRGGGTATFCHGAPTITPQLSSLRSIYLSSCILYHLIKNVFKLVCCSGCSVALATKFSHKY